MAPASFKNTPIEIQSEIFKCLLDLSRQPKPLSFIEQAMFSPGFPDPPRLVKLVWTDKETRSISLFPFNAASVSKLWRDVVAQIPECWTRVVFDVACDPTPFLDAFSWSRNLEKVEVLVFNSLSGSVDVDGQCEACRVSAIAEALQPHVGRCKSITFDVTYSSSLPSPTMFFLKEAPHLKELNLECRLDDIERRAEVWTHPIGSDREQSPTLFPKLQKVTLTGFWFMYLALYKPEWLKKVRFGPYPTICITRFTFFDRGFYTLPNFVYYISKIKASKSFSLSNLSLSYDYEDAPRRLNDHIHEISCEHLDFDSVSKAFLAQFYALANIRANETQSFTHCEIPVIRQVQYGCELTLANIVDNPHGRSLRNILGVWSGIGLTISDCPSFDDTLLSWLGSEVEYTRINPHSPPVEDEDDTTLHYSDRFVYNLHSVTTFPAEGINWLSIEDCSNFTSGAMREFIDARNDAAIEVLGGGTLMGEKEAVKHLEVTGRCQALDKQDSDWFDVHWEDMSVRWSVSVNPNTADEPDETKVHTTGPV